VREVVDIPAIFQVIHASHHRIIAEGIGEDEDDFIQE
jgi:hypothetical protein